ncbi:hypothetical protein HG531_013990 [Fusarium graminearum]|nr:hypothetical protein HG531_013990 [Fusarium graminearum]
MEVKITSLRATDSIYKPPQIPRYRHISTGFRGTCRMPKLGPNSGTGLITSNFNEHLGHSTLACLSSDNNVHLGAGLLVAALDVAHGDVLTERGAGYAAGDDSDLLAVLVDFGALSSWSSVDIEADAAALDSRSALALWCELGDDGFRAVEATGFTTGRGNDPAQAGLDWCCGVVEVVAVKTHAGLETERVTSTEASEVSLAAIGELQLSPDSVTKIELCEINVAGEDFIEDLSTLGTLQGNKTRVVETSPLDITAELAELLVNVLGVLVETGAVGDNVVSILANSGDNRVVHNTSSIGPKESRQLALHVTLVCPIRGRHFLQESSCVLALEDVLNHVAYIKE